MLTWLLSYMTVLLLPILISIFVYVVSSRTMESEIHQANNALLSQAREEMDNRFLALEQLSFEMTWNVRVQELLYSNKYLSYPNDYPYDLYQISQDLKLYASAYLSVDLFYTYLARDNTIIMPALVREGVYAYHLLHNNESFTYDHWRSIVNQTHFKGYLPMVRIAESGRTVKTVAHVSTYPTDGGKPIAANVVMMDQSRLLGAISNVELFNKGHVFVLNGNNEALVTNSDARLLDDIPFERMERSSGLFYFDMDGEKYELLYMASNQTGLKYISLIPSRLYWEKAERVRNLTYISILVSLLGGVLLTTFFLRKNYNPVRRLVQAFSGKSDFQYGRDLNEFHFIQQAVDSTLGKMDSLMDKMEQQRHLLRSHFITRLLKGRLDKQIPVDESLAAFNIRFESDDFAVILLYLEESSAFYERIQGRGNEEKLKLLLFIVTNVVEELANRHNLGYVAEIDEGLACLINFRQQDAQERRAELRRIAEEAQRFLSDHYRIHLTLSISGINSTIEGISQAYTEALDAMEYKLVMGRKEILAHEEFHSDVSEGLEMGYYYPLQVEQQLINYVKVGDFDKAKQTLDSIIDHNFKRPAVSVALARCLMLNLVSTMIKTIGEIGSVQESFLVQNPNRIERLTACETIQDMQQQMTELLRNVCEYTYAKRQQNIQNSRQQVVSELVARVGEFIAENYQDANLNISMIGNHFDMKPTYLSKLFKDQTGEGLLDTINKIRIDRAKRMIVDQNISIGEAAGSVGFNDVNAFIRTFKKYEGITPGKFKETQGP